MNDFREITIRDRDTLTPIFQRMQPVSSEYSFPYFYIWRRDYNLRFGIFGNYLCLVTNSKAAFPFAFCPIPVDGRHDQEGFKKAIEAVTTHFKEQGHELVFGRAEESSVQILKAYYHDSVKVEYLPEASDYVYEASDLISLAGKKYSGKRNHISQFKRLNGDVEYVPVDTGNISECKRIFEDWCKKDETECLQPDGCERWACDEALDNWEYFGLKGALIKVNGRFEAFTIGERISNEMAVIRFEKGNTDIHGIYAYIFREFCEREYSGLHYINREEDLGKEGLRKSKLSYYPLFMVNKYLVRC